MARNENETQSINLIGNGTVIKGDIIANGDIRIDGTLHGSLNTKGKLVIGPSGIVEGDIVCQNAEVQGQIKAQIKVNELLALKATAKLTGDIITNKLAIEPGAVFSGTCNMDAGKNIMSNVPKQEVKTQQPETIAK
ncbi:MAG: polymer-forming cytoskeletal protein [Bacteroidota bacterium]